MRGKPDSRGLDDDIDPAIRVDFDDYALVLPHKSDASGVDEAGRIECDACDVSALERGARSIGPDVVGARLPIERTPFRIGPPVEAVADGGHPHRQRLRVDARKSPRRRRPGRAPARPGAQVAASPGGT